MFNLTNYKKGTLNYCYMYLLSIKKQHFQHFFIKEKRTLKETNQTL